MAAGFVEQYGPWALIAGASEGIGLEFADQLAAQGLNLVLLSRSQAKLDKARQALLDKHGIEVRTIAADLTSAGFIEEVASSTADIEVGTMIYNAGAVHQAEYFLDRPVDEWLGLVDLNCRGPVLLAHHFGKAMRDRKRGGMIFLSSMASLGGGSYMATYAATKAFDVILPQSLWHELKPDNVHVLCLIAGATRTPAMADAGLDLSEEQEGGPAIMDAADVASEGLANLGNGPVWIPGEGNRATMEMLKDVPRADLVEALSLSTAELFGKPHRSVMS